MFFLFSFLFSVRFEKRGIILSFNDKACLGGWGKGELGFILSVLVFQANNDGELFFKFALTHLYRVDFSTLI